MVSRGAERQKIHWIPNGVNLEALPSLRPREGNQVLTVLYAGAHGLANSLETVLECARWIQGTPGMPKVHFRLVGEGARKPELQRCAKEWGLTNVSFEAAVPKKDVYQLLAEADIFVAALKRSSLYKHGISLNKLYDYMAVGRPIVLAAEVPEDPVTAAGAGICVAPEDPQAMARAICEIASADQATRLEMGRRGRQSAEKQFNFTALTDQLEEVLMKVRAQGGITGVRRAA